MTDDPVNVEAYRLVIWRDIMKKKNDLIENL